MEQKRCYHHNDSVLVVNIKHDAELQSPHEAHTMMCMRPWATYTYEEHDKIPWEKVKSQGLQFTRVLPKV